MKIIWSPEALAKLDRLQTSLADFDLIASDDLADRLGAAPQRLLKYPRLGSRRTEFTPAEVREFRVGRHVLRYELVAETIIVLAFYHGREDRC